MADKKIIAVVGATGSQGGGLVRAILDDPRGEFVARALTRDTASAKAKALADRGAEVVAADVGDVQSLERAFDGAFGAFCVTFFWHHFSPDQEKAQARAMAQAAKSARLQHVIWSTLEDTRQWVPLNDDRMPTLMGEYKCPHFDAKGEADQFFTDLALPTTFLLTTFYWDNFITSGMGPRTAPDGSLVLALPMADAPLAGIAVEDIGRCAYGVFRRGRELIGRRVGIAGELLTGEQMAAAFSRVLGRPVRYEPMTPAAYRKLGFPGAEDLGNMFQIYAECASEFARTRDVRVARELDPQLETFDEFLERNRDRIRIE